MSPAFIKQGILSEVKAGGANAAVIPGVGEAATFTANSQIRVTTTANVKGVLSLVAFERSDARAMKDQLIALLKSAAVRL